MIHYQTIQSGLLEGIQQIPYGEASGLFTRIAGRHRYKFLFESRDISPVYGRMSLAGVDPCLKVTGKDNQFEIIVLNRRGQTYLDQITQDDLSLCDEAEIKKGKITGTIKKNDEMLEERQRSQRKNVARIIRLLLQTFRIEKRVFLGLYGGFSYDFIRLFEEIPDKNPKNDINDFTLFLYDTFLFFDHLKEKTEIIVFRQNTQQVERVINDLMGQIETDDIQPMNYRIDGAEFALKQKDYEKLVRQSKTYIQNGDLFEVVFSNILKAKFTGDPLALYLKYRDVNPSPYLFFLDFGDEQLVGASPEMMVRYENGKVHLRPISGTAPRGADPIEDHENMIELLISEKERAELDMLIDLGRNDLARVCEPGIRISDYRFVEKYSRVMHTVAHLTGTLRRGLIGLDALIAALNAGTLTGAPKVEAMRKIECHEKERRGYYGGAVGYLTFSGELDTGIVIRTAHIRGGKLRFQVGATLLHDSEPEKEYRETMSKAQAFLDTFS